MQIKVNFLRKIVFLRRGRKGSEGGSGMASRTIDIEGSGGKNAAKGDTY